MQELRDRKVILLVSSLILFATIAGVCQQNLQAPRRGEAPEEMQTTFPEPLHSAYTEFRGVDGDTTSEAAVAVPKEQTPRTVTLGTLQDGGLSPVRNVRRFHKFALVPPPPAPAIMDVEPSSFPAPAEPVVVAQPFRRHCYHGTLVDNMILSAVIDNKAIFKIGTDYRREHGLQSAVSLGPGEEFESVTVVSIDGKSVTVSEGMKRSVKTIAALR